MLVIRVLDAVVREQIDKETPVTFATVKDITSFKKQKQKQVEPPGSNVYLFSISPHKEER